MSIPRPEGAPHLLFPMGNHRRIEAKSFNAALSRGGEDCDLYFQHAASTNVQLSDGKVSQAGTHVDLGMGVRVVVGDQVGILFEDLSPESLIQAAKAAAICVMPTKVERRHLKTGKCTELLRSHRTLGSRGHGHTCQHGQSLGTRCIFTRPKGKPRIVFGRWRICCHDRTPRWTARRRLAPCVWVTCVVPSRRTGSERQTATMSAARGGLGYFDRDRQRRLVTEAANRALFQLKAGKPPAGEMPAVLAAGLQPYCCTKPSDMAWKLISIERKLAFFPLA